MFQPDGRLIDPLQVLDTTPPTNMLSGFNTLDSNGEWTLFIADQGAGEAATLNSWSITVIAIRHPPDFRPARVFSHAITP